MSRCRPAVVAAALSLCALLVPVAYSADERKALTIDSEWANCSSLAFSPDGKLFAVGTLSRRTIELRESATGKKLSTVETKGWAWAVAFSPDGKTLASADSGAVCLWDVQTRKGEVLHREESGVMDCLAFSPDGKRLAAAASFEQTVYIWDTATQKLEVKLKLDTDHTSALMFTPDGTKLAIGMFGGEIYVADIAAGKITTTLKGHAKGVGALAFTPDGKTLHSAGRDGDLRRWDLKTGKAELTTIKLPTLVNVVFSPDRRLVASGDQKGAVTVWETETGKRLLGLEGHTDLVSALAFSADGKTLASGESRTGDLKFEPVGGWKTRTIKLHPIDLPAKK